MTPYQEKNRILIIGCGQLGSRHLQAVTALHNVSEIEVVDPRPEALQTARKLLTETPQRQFPVSIRWVTSIEEATKGGDLCIIATQSKGRAALINTVAEMLNYRNFLVEKIVTQSVEDYEDVLSFAKNKHLSIWVNCKSRAYPSYKRIKANLKKGEPIHLSVIGGNHGLANNGIHVADLFSFLSQEKKIGKVSALVDPILHPSKRGSELFDLSGTLHGSTEKGSQFVLSFSPHHNVMPQLSVVSPSYRAIVDDAMQWCYESSIETGWVWRPVAIEANLMVSYMTKAFVTDILKTGRCELPTLEDCYPAHEFILGSLKPHFSQLLKKELKYCPVT